jgi:RNA recognition motif-containing protein
MIHRVAVPGTIFISDISSECTETELKELFLDYGKITELKLEKDSILSMAYVTLETVDNAFQAIMDLEGTTVRGEALR